VLAPSLQLLGTRWDPSVTTARWLGVYVCLRPSTYLVTPLLSAVGRPGVDAPLRGAWLGMLAGLIATVGRQGIATVGAIQAAVAMALLVGYVVAAARLTAVAPAALVADLTRQLAVAALAGGAVLASWPTLVLLGTVFTAVNAEAAALPSPKVATDLRRLRRALG
jgi:hypothetical protein